MSKPKTITLDEQDWLVIDQALQLMPYGRVVGLYQRLNVQFASQVTPPEAVEEDASVPDGLEE